MKKYVKKVKDMLKEDKKESVDGVKQSKLKHDSYNDPKKGEKGKKYRYTRRRKF